MAKETFFCGQCGTPLYYGRKFQEHGAVRACPQCGAANPISFHYCYRCGAKILAREEVEETA
jgi:DNA-directed RNA polymerase subunit RPC12/RpoP